MIAGHLPAPATTASPMATVLALDLIELTQELARNAIDLPAAVTMVQRDFRLAVRSFLALTLTMHLDGAPPVTLTLAAAPVAVEDVGSAFSLRLDSEVADRFTLSCYAGRPESLTELAGELAASLRLPSSAVDLAPPRPRFGLVPGLHGLAQYRAAHESVGVRRAAG